MVRFPFPTASRLAPIALAALLAGCGGSGGGGGAGGSASSGGGAAAPPAASSAATSITHTDPFTAAGAAAASYVTSFDATAAAAVRAEPEFAAQKFTARIDGRSYDVFSLRDVRAEYPLSVGLTGAGETIAIVDSGVLATHDELAGKPIRVFGPNVPDAHGTGVAAIAAGLRDGRGITGVAPGAGLHLSTFSTDFGALADATRDAMTASDAVVQNNSWGLVDAGGRTTPITRVLDYQAANPGASDAQALQAAVGGSVADVQRYLDALASFTARGVVVFAAPNDRGSTANGIMDGLPLLAPELTPGWIVAVNAVPTFVNGEIASAERLSAGCMQMAHTCLAANGTVRTAGAGGPSDYRLATGTSFAAPQIAAGVALLAQAFPSLPENDLRRRLLASAANGFFVPTGAVDFGNGVVHGYNADFGHGFMDLRAALLPIGAVGIPTTSSAHAGVTPLGSSTVASADPQGDALRVALADARITVFDSLGADFRTSAEALYGGRIAGDFDRRLRRFAAASAPGGGIASFRSAPTSEGGAAFAVHAGETTDVLHALGLAAVSVPVSPSAGSLAALAGDALAVGLSAGAGRGRSLAVFGFSNAEHGGRPADPYRLVDATAPADTRFAAGAGFAFAQALPGGGELALGATLVEEHGSALGMRTTGALGELSGTSGALDAALAVPLAGGRARLMLNAQVGTGAAQADGLVRGADDTVFSAFGVALELGSVGVPGDSLGLFARQPLRMERGSLAMTVPEGRTADGTVLWRDLEVPLTPTARQIDLGVSYAARLPTGDDVRLAAAFAIDEGHVAGTTGASVMAAFQRRF